MESALNRRIVQLEKERDELQKDIEAICLQQSGVAGTVNSYMQARRVATLEQELGLAKDKAALLTRENRDLQEELSEIYRLKGRLTEAFKAAVEKNNQVEKEVKFYQSKVAAAFADRDKAAVEAERARESEHVLVARDRELHNRLKVAEGQSKEHEAQKMELQCNLDIANTQLDVLNKLIDKFWDMRESAIGTSEADDNKELDKAGTLLMELDTQWKYGGASEQAAETSQQEANDAQLLAEENRLPAVKEQMRASALEAQLATVTKDFDVSTRALQMQLAEARDSQEQAAEAVLTCKQKLDYLEETSISKLQQVQKDLEDVGTNVDVHLEDERQWLATLIESFKLLMEEMVAREVELESVDKYAEQERRSSPDEDIQVLIPTVRSKTSTNSKSNDDGASSPSQNEIATESENSVPTPAIRIAPAGKPEVVGEDELRIRQEHVSAMVALSKSATDMDEESQKALTQALHEKVEALLLLSQQEERFHLESKTIEALECQIKDLTQKISQVTSEKVSALMEVAQLRQDCHRFEEREKELIWRLQLHRSTNAGGRLLPASWSESNTPQNEENVDKQLVVPKPSQLTTSGYLKSWLG